MELPKLDESLENEEKDDKFELPSLEMPPLDFEDDFEEVYEEVEEIEDDFDDYEELTSVDSYDEVESDTEELSDDYNPDFEEDEESFQENKYVDEKKKKIKPLGGKRSKRKIKASEFDERKNLMSKTRILRTIVMLIIVGLFGFGLKNTFFPSHVYTSEQIKAFARQGAGQTGFPRERGQAYAESFVNTYLTINPEKPELLDSLSHYYGGNVSAAHMGFEQLRIGRGSSVKQDLLIPAKTFEVIMTTDHSSLYKVSAFVSNTDGSTSEGAASTGRWVSFAINVYYDKDTDRLAITPDSPSIIPTYEVSAQLDVPNAAPLGNGSINNEILPSLLPTIHGYINAYAESSVEHHESIIQYISDKNDPELYTGFGGSVALNGKADAAITKTAYDTDKSGEYKVDVSVDWVDNAALDGDNKVTYKARYVMTIKDVGDGKYLVSSFKPFLFYVN